MLTNRVAARKLPLACKQLVAGKIEGSYRLQDGLQYRYRY
jgi:hypothetical protein